MIFLFSLLAEKGFLAARTMIATSTEGSSTGIYATIRNIDAFACRLYRPIASVFTGNRFPAGTLVRDSGNSPGRGYDALKQDRYETAVEELRAALALDSSLVLARNFLSQSRSSNNTSRREARRELEAVRSTSAIIPTSPTISAVSISMTSTTRVQSGISHWRFLNRRFLIPPITSDSHISSRTIFRAPKNFSRKQLDSVLATRALLISLEWSTANKAVKTRRKNSSRFHPSSGARMTARLTFAPNAARNWSREIVKTLVLFATSSTTTMMPTA